MNEKLFLKWKKEKSVINQHQVWSDGKKCLVKEIFSLASRKKRGKSHEKRFSRLKLNEND